MGDFCGRSAGPDLHRFSRLSYPQHFVKKKVSRHGDPRSTLRLRPLKLNLNPANGPASLDGFLFSAHSKAMKRQRCRDQTGDTNGNSGSKQSFTGW